MKKFALLVVPVFALAACGEEPAPEPVATETLAPEPIVSVPAPDEELFKELFAATCPDAKPVNVAVCRRGMGSETAACEFGLGEDEYLRNDATIEIDETGEGWILSDAEATCAEYSQ